MYYILYHKFFQYLQCRKSIFLYIYLLYYFLDKIKLMHSKYKNILSARYNITERSSSIKFTAQELIALNFRLILQTWRQPSQLIAGMLQPLLWLILFGALFQNAPINLFSSNTRYNQFLSAGIVVFTAFTGSLNAGLALMFDREFGFLNRLIVAPLVSKESIIYSSTVFISIVESSTSYLYHRH